MAVAPTLLTLVNEALASVYSDCRRCARKGGGSKSSSGGWVALGARRPPAANVVNPWGCC